MTQCSHRPYGLPACLLVLVFGAAFLPNAAVVTGASQEQRYRVVRQEDFRQEAGTQGRVLASVGAGVEVLRGKGAVQDGWLPVALDGWIWSGSVGRTNRDGHNLAVTIGRGENLRTGPNGGVVARLLSGFLLDEVRREGAWVRARRNGWMPEASLAPATTDASAGDTTPPRDSSGATTPAVGGGSALDRAVVARESELTATPEGPRSGALAPETPVRILARSGDWVRVQSEGWIKEADLRPTAPGLIAGLTAAELRSRPQDYQGKLVQWTLQYLSVATADELRPEIPNGQRYLLARGPLPEAGFVYVTLSGAQSREAEQLTPLSQIVVIAKIRNGRTKYLGNPVVDLVEMRIRRP